MKKILISLLVILGSLMAFNISVRHTSAVCIPDPSGFGICPPPPPAPGSTVSTTAPADNTIHLNPPSTTWPGSAAFSGDKQPFYDVGNDTDYPKAFNDIPIYLRKGDNVNVIITNASPDCQATDPATGLKYPDYSDNFTNAGPPTTFGISSAKQGGTFRSDTRGSTAACSNDVEFDNITDSQGDCITVDAKCVDGNGLSGSGYIKFVMLRISVSATSTVKGENAYRIKLVNTTGSSNVGSSGDLVGYGRREASLASGNVYTQILVFGVDESCNNFERHRTGSLVYADMDAKNLSWNPAIRIVLQREPWADSPNFDNWTNVTTISNNTLRNQSNSTNHAIPVTTFDNEYRYRLLLENVGVRNTIFISMGGDISQVSGKYHQSASDCSDFSCTATPVGPMDVRVTITNNGPYPIGNGFQVRNPDAPAWPATGFTSDFTPNGTASHVFTRPADAIETYTMFDGTGANSQAIPFTNPNDPNGPSVPCSTSGAVSITCTAKPPSPTEVGQTGTFIFNFGIKNTTANPVTVTYSSDQGVPAGSLSNVTAPSPGSTTVGAGQTIPQGNLASSVNIKALMNSNTTLTVTATYPGDPSPTPCADSVTISALPYFQVWNGDVSTGGGFASPNNSPFTNSPYSCGTSSDPAYVTTDSASQSYSYPFSGSKYSGSIIGFGKQTGNRGSRVDFGAVAMGQIPGSSTGPVGFFSGYGTNPPPVFANTPAVFGAAGMGGYLRGYAPNQCVKDYFTDSQDSSSIQPSTGLQNDIGSCVNNSCQFKATSSVTIGSPGCTINVNQGQQVTLYVPGDVKINCDIVYQKNFDPTTQGNIPYLAIIAKGNITVDNSVSELDGLYVAQPTGDGASTTAGIFYTCDPTAYCNNQLVVNGAVIAQQVELLRSHGTLDTPSSDPGGITGNPAEIFNFVPSMVIGEPALPSQFGETHGVFSLAPTF